LSDIGARVIHPVDVAQALDLYVVVRTSVAPKGIHAVVRRNVAHPLKVYAVVMCVIVATRGEAVEPV
jgi:hypothetical protein